MIEKEELLTLIPHSGKMMMLDRIINYNLDEKSVEAEYKITDECIFYDDKEEGVPSWAGFEFIAQAVASLIGIKNREKEIPPKEGYIISVSQVNISLPILKKNSIIKIVSRELNSDHPVYIFSGEIFSDGHEALSGKITVMEAVEK